MREKLPPGITFQPETILRLNNKAIEAPDVTPAYIRSLIDSLDDTLIKHISALHARSQERARNPQRLAPPTIFITRLALRETDGFEVFSDRALRRAPHSRYYNQASDLNDTFIPYWAAITEADFIPQVVTTHNATKPTNAGIWLGVRKQL